MAGSIPEIQQDIVAARRSPLGAYRRLVVGLDGLWPLVRYELVLLVSAWIPGALGLWLRGRLYPLLLGACGRNVTFGTHVVLRHPHKIRIGDDVLIDDNCVLDAKGDGNEGIRVGNGVFVGRNSILYTKNGDLILEDHVNISAFCDVFSASRVRIGRSTLLAAYCYLVGGGHRFERTDVAILEQPRASSGIDVGEGCWLGAGSIVLDGVRIGSHCVVGANAVVTQDLPEYSIAVGTPARVVRDRRSEPEP